MMAKGDPKDTFEFDPIGSHVTNGSISSATTLTPPEDATKILIQASGQNVRYTLDGTTPTASVGFMMAADDPPILIPLHISTVLKVIQESATATIDYQWGKG